MYSDGCVYGDGGCGCVGVGGLLICTRILLSLDVSVGLLLALICMTLLLVSDCSSPPVVSTLLSYPN